MSKTLYDILDIANDASVSTLEAAYLRAKNAAQHNNDSNLTLNAVEEAYRILSKPAQRAVYDNKLEALENFRMDRAMQANSDGVKKWLIVAGILFAGALFYGYTLNEKKHAREAAERLHKEEIAASERAELKRQEEQKKLVEDDRLAQQQEKYERERLSQQFRQDAREYARDQERMERDKQNKLRQEQEQQRRDNPPAFRPGVVYMR